MALTHPDTSRQSHRPPPAPLAVPPQLTPAQLNAIDLLIGGATDGEAAAASGVSRQTVCVWRRHHAEFQAELNRRRQDLWRASGDRLRALLPRALTTVAGALDDEYDYGRALKAALAVLKLAGAERLLTPPDATAAPLDAEGILEAAAQAWGDALLSGLGSANWRDTVRADWQARVTAAEHVEPVDPAAGGEPRGRG